MDEFRKKSVAEQVRGKAGSTKGKGKGRGKLTGNRDLESEGEIEQREEKVREKMGKAGRTASDAAERIKDRLRGYED